MAKHKTLLIFLSTILFLLAAYLLLTSESVKELSGLNSEAKKTVLSAEAYRSQVKSLFISYRNLATSSQPEAGQAAAIRNQLLAIKNLPAEYRDLHLGFVQALDRLADYFNAGGEQAKNLSLKAADRLMAEYSWLAN